MSTTETNNTVTVAIQVLTEAVASEVLKNIQSTIEEKVELSLSKYVESQDFHYMIEDAVKEKTEELVQDCIDNVSLSVRID